MWSTRILMSRMSSQATSGTAPLTSSGRRFAAPAIRPITAPRPARPPPPARGGGGPPPAPPAGRPPPPPPAEATGPRPTPPDPGGRAQRRLRRRPRCRRGRPRPVVPARGSERHSRAEDRVLVSLEQPARRHDVHVHAEEIAQLT